MLGAQQISLKSLLSRGSGLLMDIRILWALGLWVLWTLGDGEGN